MSYILEVCVESVESAIVAKQGGANRLELCSNLIIGGTTPDINLFNLIKENVDIDINVLIRPRFGDFLYSDYEFEIMKRDIETFKKAGANGVVIGILKSDGSLNLSQIKTLVDIAEGMDVTLHRAFDVCNDPMKALEEAKTLGINTILTSGQQNNCIFGKKLIRDLVKESKNEIDILVGSGVNSSNISELVNYTKSTSFHLSGKKIIDSKMQYRKKDVSMGLPSISEYNIIRTDLSEIVKVRQAIEKHMAERNNL